MVADAKNTRIVPDSGLPASEDRRVLHAVGRNVEWLFDAGRFPGFSAIVAAEAWPYGGPGPRRPSGRTVHDKKPSTHASQRMHGELGVPNGADKQAEGA